MDGVRNIINDLASVFSWQDKREQDELMGYLNKYMYLPQCQNFIINNIRNVKDGNTEELRQVYQELIQNNELELAQKISFLLNEENVISEETYKLLEVYLRSEKFNKDVESVLMNP
ncbi:hypothetical protein [Pelosinus sp. IPA-1]|uniref:hypothetical protein n=1 Tax=Pelosinus sp. IPA-1 TaxID=3029569 RepID=UPI0024361D7F|nr:hypothetical protein [Pelosinus sp. IPA-1]GMB00947.1 hypothetical protein PIPA1_37460 [Pelosinus sp. IPA-1]